MVSSTGEIPTRSVGYAIALMLFAHLLFAVVDTSTKWLIGAGFLALQLAFMRYFVHFVITLADSSRPAPSSLALGWRMHALIALRAFCLVSSTVANFIALGHLSLAVTSAILFLAPVIVCRISALFLREQVRLGHWIAIAVGFTGVLIMIRPFADEVNWYALLMLYPATGMAFYALLSRHLAPKVRTSTLQLYTGALGSAVLLPAAILTWQWPDNTLNWLLFLGIGAIAWAGHQAMTRAHIITTANVLMPFGYSFVIYLTLAGWLIFGDRPDAVAIAGSLAIIGSGLAVWRLNRT